MTRILIPSGALGLGYDADALARGVANRPDLIAIDGGSTDSGPSYLGRGVSKYSRSGTKAEWKGLIEARAKAGCPLVIGTAGTCGTDSTVDWLVEITRECLKELGQTARIATLRCQQPAERVSRALAAGAIQPLGNAPEISEALLASCENIVALAGAEQVLAAIETGADIIIAGRTTDTVIISALPIARGDHAGGAWHGAKIGECGALCATNPQSGVIEIEFDKTGFRVTPLADGAACTPHTVSAHMLYENSDPFILFEPGGYLDVTGARYQSIDGRSVRVEGSVWVPAKDYTVKLEGARIAGYQTILLATVRDRHYVLNITRWCDDIVERHARKMIDRLGADTAAQVQCELRIMGLNATLGALETREDLPPEVGILAILTAPTQALANEAGKLLNPYLLHHPLTREEEQPTFAFPFSPAEIDRGAAYEFCLNHVMVLTDPMEAFVLEVIDA